MGELFVYILKSAACLACFYLFYRLLLSKETFHRFNRFAILGILLLSSLLPLIEITLHQPTEISQTVLTWEQLLLLANATEVPQVTASTSNHVFYIQIVLIVYLAGILFFISRHVYSLIRVYKLVRNNPRMRLKKGIILILHANNDIAPFSWMKYIVLPQKDYEENEKAILTHELAHIEKRHSIDLLLAEVCIFFQWFNPAAWLLKQELQNIHEFEADEIVIRKGIDAKQYQLLIIKKAAGARLYSIANSFNHSKLKKRITMMLKEKSSPWASLKYLYILPVAAIAVTAFARPEISNELNEISAVKVNDLATIVPTNKAENNSSVSYMENPVEITSSPDEEPLKVETAHTVTVSKALPESSTKNSPYEDEATPVEEEPVFAIEQNPLKIRNEKGKDPLIIIDGKEASAAVLSAISPDKIESVSVLKNETSVEKYGEKGANGVIIVELKQGESKISHADAQALPDGVLILVDGKETDVKTVAPTDILSINVTKGDQISADMVRKYGSKAKNGVIEITSKHAADAKGGNKNNDTIKVSGKVVDKHNKPVVGAAILIVGTNVGTISDLDGNFIIMASEGSEISVSYIDMKTQKVKVKKEQMTVKLEND